MKQRKDSLIAWIKMPLAEGVSAAISQGHFSSFPARISGPLAPRHFYASAHMPQGTFQRCCCHVCLITKKVLGKILGDPSGVIWRRKWQPTPVFLPGESHGQKSLEGYSPWDHKKSDTTERLTLTQGRGYRERTASFPLWGPFVPSQCGYASGTGAL